MFYLLKNLNMQGFFITSLTSCNCIILSPVFRIQNLLKRIREESCQKNANKKWILYLEQFSFSTADLAEQFVYSIWLHFTFLAHNIRNIRMRIREAKRLRIHADPE